MRQQQRSSSSSSRSLLLLLAVPACLRGWLQHSSFRTRTACASLPCLSYVNSKSSPEPPSFGPSGPAVRVEFRVSDKPRLASAGFAVISTGDHGAGPVPLPALPVQLRSRSGHEPTWSLPPHLVSWGGAGMNSKALPYVRRR